VELQQLRERLIDSETTYTRDLGQLQIARHDIERLVRQNEQLLSTIEKVSTVEAIQLEALQADATSSLTQEMITMQQERDRSIAELEDARRKSISKEAEAERLERELREGRCEFERMLSVVKEEKSVLLIQNEHLMEEIENVKKLDARMASDAQGVRMLEEEKQLLDTERGKYEAELVENGYKIAKLKMEMRNMEEIAREASEAHERELREIRRDLEFELHSVKEELKGVVEQNERLVKMMKTEEELAMAKVEGLQEEASRWRVHAEQLDGVQGQLEHANKQLQVS